MIERIGLVNFLEGIGVDVDPNMVASTRVQSSYVRMDGWDEEAEKWFERAKASSSDAAALIRGHHNCAVAGMPLRFRKAKLEFRRN